MRSISLRVVDAIRCALVEDTGRGDVTTLSLAKQNAVIEAVIMAKRSGVVSGIDIAKQIFKSVNKKVIFSSKTKDARSIKTGKLLARIKGPAKDILRAERVALNFLSHLSGIATATSKFVKRTQGYRAKIMDTRKTLPGLRELEKYAVRCGGGFNHRMGLYDQVLIKDNHIKIEAELIAGGRKSKISQADRKEAVRRLIRKAKQKSPRGVKIEIEVNNLPQFETALKEKPDIIMLDNMSIPAMRKAVKLRKKSRARTLLEASGKITFANVRKVASTGVDRISVGAITHSAKALDLSLEIL